MPLRDDDIHNMEDFWDALAEWSVETFGPASVRGPIGPVRHLKKECDEITGAIEARRDVGMDEYADLLFLTFDAARRAGLSFHALLEQAKRKLVVNKARQWPTPTSDEPVQHVKQPHEFCACEADWPVKDERCNACGKHVHTRRWDEVRT
jgi:hypothetical protein